MKKKTSIRKRLLLQHFTVILLTIIFIESILFVGLYQYYYKNTEDFLATHAKNSANFANKFMNVSPFLLHQQIPKLIEEFQVANTELQIISPAGNILASSSGFTDEHIIDRATLEKATIDNPSIWIGKNKVTNERVMAAAVPLSYDHETIIFFRYVVSLEKIDQVVRSFMLGSISIGLGIILLVMILSMLLAKQITAPLEKITNAASSLAEGNLKTGIDEDFIGELGILAKKFNEMSHALQKNDQMKNQFFSSVSHELRTPLTSIKGWTDTLLSGNLQNVDETKKGLQIITTETERLIVLVEELLDFSRYNNDSITIQPGGFNICQLIEEVINQFEYQLIMEQVQPVIDMEKPYEVYGDRNRLKQVLINVIDNTLKYGKANKIEIQSSWTDNDFILTIRDNGIGISPEALPNIFNPFYKAHKHKTGTGLGLAISKKIIDKHNGKLLIDSKENEGTTVTIILPQKC